MNEFKTNIIFSGIIMALCVGIIASVFNDRLKTDENCNTLIEKATTTSVTTYEPVTTLSNATTYEPVTITAPITTQSTTSTSKITTTKHTNKEATSKEISTVTETKSLPEYKSSVQETSVDSDISDNELEWIEFNCSAYCTCEKCTNGGSGITASGTKPKANWTIAASKIYPFGTLIYIEGYGTFCVKDRGGSINENKLDIYFATHQEACNFGRQQLKGYVIKMGD